MNTKKTMSMTRWYNNRSFLTKAVLLYLVCAAVPMLLATVYNYSLTKNTLIRQAYNDIRQSMDSMESSINLILQPYETVTQLLDNDKTLNIMLNRDYSDQTYSELAYYCWTTWDNLVAIYPSVNWFRFYSGNESLPENNYYFYRLEHLNEKVAALADSRRGYAIASGNALEDAGDDIIILSRIDYYASNIFKNYLVLSLRRDIVAEQLFQERDGWSAYLLDSQGTILASSGNGEDFPQKDWSTLTAGQIHMDGDTLFSWTALDMEMTLVVTVDQEILLRDARDVPRRALAGFLLLSLLAFAAAFTHHRAQNRRLETIIDATKKIGIGQFDCTLEDIGSDEFGQIAKAINQMNNQIDRLIQENYDRQLRIKSSEMNLLQEQINPHFLYNALAVISSISLQEGGKRTIQSIRHLADFYRITLSKGRQTITVGEEVALLRNYMNIQMLRFSDTLEISYDIDPSVISWPTIKLILQPLVENAIHHGRQEEQMLHISVRAGRIADRLYYEVEDDGAGIEPEKLEALRTELTTLREGFGLKNVDIRIKLTYGEEYGVQIASILGQGTNIHVEIPKGSTDVQPTDA